MSTTASRHRTLKDLMGRIELHDSFKSESEVIDFSIDVDRSGLILG
jgi:hypothetical protein